MRRMIWGALVIVGVILVGVIALNMGDWVTQAACASALCVVLGTAIVMERWFFAPVHAATRLAQGYLRGAVEPVARPRSAELAALHEIVLSLGAACQEKSALAETVLHGIITPMVIVDAQGCIEWVNESMVRLTEQDATPDRFFGQHFSEFFYGEARTSISDKAMQTQEKQFVKTQMHSRKGNTKYISIASTPIRDAKGHIRGAFTTVMDFTNVKMKEDHIIAQNERIATGARHALQIAHTVAELARELIAKVAQSGDQAEIQQMRATDVAAAIDEMNATILEVARNASSASRAAAHAEDTVHAGVKVVENVIDVVGQVREQAAQLKTEMNGLGTQADGIGRIMAVINDIADQTNLLALNAAIEAARAGAAGRGFAVVADEVRKLAEKTMQATSEVGGYIRAIQESTKTSIHATDGTAAVIDQAAILTNEANESLSSILQLVGETNDQVRSIATATEEQSAASEEIGKATTEVSVIAQHTVEAMGSIVDGVHSLARMAAELDQAMEAMLAAE